MTRLLRDYSLVMCLLTGLFVGLVLTFHTVLTPVLPSFDGQGYTIRCYALYGYLHTGQWHDFWLLLTSPNQSIFPLHYLLFLLLPPAWAGFAGYVAVYNLFTFLLLSYAVFFISKCLNRREWAPIIFLFCAVNNVALSDYYAFYLEMQFLGVGLLIIGLQMTAWQSRDLRFNLLSGLALGVLFFLKPANALIFFTLFAVSDFIYTAGFLARSDRCLNRKFIVNWCKTLGATLMVFTPIFILFFLCGGWQTILQLIDHNEVNGDHLSLPSNIVLRLFYFPLCLSAFYNVLLVIVFLIAIGFVDRYVMLSSKLDTRAAFPIHLCVPILVSYLIFGEFFSFWMEVKPLRSLIVIIPLFWLFLLWLCERLSFKTHCLWLAAFIYAGLLFSQKAWNIFGAKGPLIENTYQLSSSSWVEMPTAWHHDLSFYQILCNRITRELPPSGVICTNSITSKSLLAWELQSPDLLRGVIPRYEIRNLLDYKGNYFYQSLVGAKVIVVVAWSPDLSELTGSESANILNYGKLEWCDKDHPPRLLGTLARDNSPLGFQFTLERPLTQTQVDSTNKAAPFIDLPKIEAPWDSTIYGRRYSNEEALQVLKQWFDKKFK